MGRLIDEDSVKRRMRETMDYQDLYLPVHFEMCMNDVPTVKPASPWHRVEEEPKESGKQYVVWASKGYAYCDKWLGDRWLISSVAPETVTYWMPIEPPKEDA